jgi:hypothetical protein
LCTNYNNEMLSIFSRNGERSKSSSLSEPSGGGVLEPQEAEPLMNGDIVKPGGKTPVVSINSLAADREGAVSPRSYSLVKSYAPSIIVDILPTYQNLSTDSVADPGSGMVNSPDHISESLKNNFFS